MSVSKELQQIDDKYLARLELAQSEYEQRLDSAKRDYSAANRTAARMNKELVKLINEAWRQAALKLDRNV